MFSCKVLFIFLAVSNQKKKRVKNVKLKNKPRDLNEISRIIFLFFFTQFSEWMVSFEIYLNSIKKKNEDVLKSNLGFTYQILWFFFHSTFPNFSFLIFILIEENFYILCWMQSSCCKHSVLFICFETRGGWFNRS